VKAKDPAPMPVDLPFMSKEDISHPLHQGKQSPKEGAIALSKLKLWGLPHSGQNDRLCRKWQNANFQGVSAHLSGSCNSRLRWKVEIEGKAQRNQYQARLRTQVDSLQTY